MNARLENWSRAKKLNTLQPPYNLYILLIYRDAFRERGALGRLSFWGPMQVLSVWLFVWKRESMPVLCVVPPQQSIFCGADFGSTIAVDLQQKLKTFLHSYEQIAIRSFLGIYSFFV